MAHGEQFQKNTHSFKIFIGKRKRWRCRWRERDREIYKLTQAQMIPSRIAKNWFELFLWLRADVPNLSNISLLYSISQFVIFFAQIQKKIPLDDCIKLINLIIASAEYFELLFYLSEFVLKWKEAQKHTHIHTERWSKFRDNKQLIFILNAMVPVYIKQSAFTLIAMDFVYISIIENKCRYYVASNW